MSLTTTAPSSETARASDPTTLSASAQAERIRSGALSPIELAEAVIARVQACDPQLHAFVAFDPDLVRAQAFMAEEALAQGKIAGPLHGVPVSVSDLFCTSDLPTSFGSEAYIGHRPQVDDIAVQRLRAAGAIILGKTNISEFGYGAVAHNRVAQETCNPWDTTKTTTGSSAGSAAAVASGMGAISLGCDSGGGVRGPAAMTGIFGFKPSFGRIPMYPAAREPEMPGVSSRETLEHVGPMTRTVADAGLLMSVLTGPDMRDRHSLPADGTDWLSAPKKRLSMLRIAYTPDFGYARTDPEVACLCHAAAQKLADGLGCTLELASPDIKGLSGAFWVNVIRDSDLSALRDLADDHKIYMPGLNGAFAQAWKDSDFATAHILRQEVAKRMASFMADYDLFLMPTAPTTAYELGAFGPQTIAGQPAPGNGDLLPSHWPFNLTGQPAASVPAGFTSDGLPVGLQIVGRHLADVTVLGAASAFERLAPWAVEWPRI